LVETVIIPRSDIGTELFVGVQFDQKIPLSYREGANQNDAYGSVGD